MDDRSHSSYFRWVRRVGKSCYQARPWYNNTHVNLGVHETQEAANWAIRKWIKSRHKWRPDNVLPKYVYRDCEGKYLSRKLFGSKKVIFGPFPTPEEADQAMRFYLAEVYGEHDYLAAAYPEEVIPRFEPMSISGIASANLDS